MRRTVIKRFAPGRWHNTRIHGARRARIPGMPWFRCFTNRWWHPSPRGLSYMLTEATTGFVPVGYGEDTRTRAIWYAEHRLKRLPRAKILAAIARTQAGHYDRQRIPQRFRARTV